MYLSTKTLFATFLLSTVVRGEFIRSSSVSASAHSDPVLRHLTSSGHDHDYGHFELTSVDTAKIFKFRDQFLKWKDAHSVVYESIELELHKMLVWVENHGELKRTIACGCLIEFIVLLCPANLRYLGCSQTRYWRSCWLPWNMDCHDICKPIVMPQFLYLEWFASLHSNIYVSAMWILPQSLLLRTQH